MRPQVHFLQDGGWMSLGPLQVNWGTGGAMGRGLRLHLTWPRVRSVYLGKPHA
jgi:hypothetical protein